MTYIKDFEECDYITHPKDHYQRIVNFEYYINNKSNYLNNFNNLCKLPKMIAIGWLDKEYEYPKGNVSEEVLNKIEILIRNPWGYGCGCFKGWHTCNICFEEYLRQNYDELYGSSGGKNIYVPVNNDFLYVFPQLILHYIKIHNYCPPEEFQKAVLDCPDPLSQEYFNKLNIPEEYEIELERQRGYAEWENIRKEKERNKLGKVDRFFNKVRELIG